MRRQETKKERRTSRRREYRIIEYEERMSRLYTMKRNELGFGFEYSNFGKQS
jgi:hypothetical protein